MQPSVVTAEAKSSGTAIRVFIDHLNLRILSVGAILLENCQL